MKFYLSQYTNAPKIQSRCTSVQDHFYSPAPMFKHIQVPEYIGGTLIWNEKDLYRAQLFFQDTS